MANHLELIKSYDEFRRASGREAKDAKPQASGAEATPQVPGAEAAPQTPDANVARQAPGAEARAQAPGTGATPQTPPASVSPASPGSDDAERRAPAPPRQQPGAANAAETLYRDALGRLSRLFDAAAMEKASPDRLRATVIELEETGSLVVRSTAEGRDLLRKAMGTYAEGEGFALPHSLNVAILAVYLGRELGIAESALPVLCLAGFVHDVGGVHLPRGLLAESESLTPAEWEQMRSRPTRSYEMLQQLGGHYGRVAEIAYQVHERLDGSGYPRGLQGDEILAEARILGTVDFFESFAHPRPHKTTVPGSANHGIQILMQMADKFGAATLKALVGSIGLFPIGSYVRLSGGEIGRVVDVKKENPMRPQVEVLLTSERQPPKESRTLDLLSTPHIYVSRALTACDLRELGLLPPPSERELPPSLGFDTGRS